MIGAPTPKKEIAFQPNGNSVKGVSTTVKKGGI